MVQQVTETNKSSAEDLAGITASTGRSLEEILQPFENEMRMLEDVIDGLIAADASRYFPEADLLCHGGKRLRGAICIAVARSLTSDSERIARAVEVAACVEGIHFSSLLHDDVIDSAAERRGIATLHQKYGRTGAILAGDLLYVKIFNRLLEIEDGSLTKIITVGTEEMVEGETMETLAAKLGKEPTRASYLKCISKKTAAFFGASAAAGAVIAVPRGNGRNPEMIRAAMEAYGRNLGMAFQIVDDILDWTADPDELGKDLQSDIRNGKLTLPLLLLIEKDAVRGRKLIKEATDGELGPLFEELREHGCIDESLEVAAGFVTKARAALREAGPANGSETLEALLDFSVERGY